jgi:hypothetical protein
MKNDWPTKTKDMQIAQMIMEEYAQHMEVEALGLFEVVVNQDEKRMNFRIANWVLALVQHFNSLYDATQADYVVRQVISYCMKRDQVVH